MRAAAAWVVTLLLALAPTAWSQIRGTEREGPPGPPPPPQTPPSAALEIVALLLPGQPSAEEIARALNLVLVVQYPLLLLDSRLAVYRLQPGAQVRDVLAQFEQRQILADENGTFIQPQQDPLVSRQYALEKVGAVRAHGTLRGRGVTVAVLDAGVDSAHEDLRDGIAAQETLVEGMSAMSADAHGTAVAGIIAARDNGVGMLGIAPAARLIALQACVPRAGGTLESTCTAHRVARGIDAAVRHQAQILNLSVGGPPNRVITRLIDAALSRGLAVVAAAGNNGPSGPPLYPAAIPGVLAVGAADSRDVPYERSNLGTHVTLLAPGVELLTTFPQHRYLFATGTSFAAAVASGALALLIEAGRGRSMPELIAALKDGAIKEAGQRIGRLDLCRSLVLLDQPDVCR